MVNYLDWYFYPQIGTKEYKLMRKQMSNQYYDEVYSVIFPKYNYSKEIEYFKANGISIKFSTHKSQNAYDKTMRKISLVSGEFEMYALEFILEEMSNRQQLKVQLTEIMNQFIDISYRKEIIRLLF
jgi:CRISPR/Cas system-associated endonuclease Cas3-HD